MCLILLAIDTHPDYSLVLGANRDEFYDRPTAPAAFWEDAPAVLGGRDLGAGGTWLAMDRRGRLAAISNYRQGVREPDAARSRCAGQVPAPGRCASIPAAHCRARRILFLCFHLIQATGGPARTGTIHPGH